MYDHFCLYVWAAVTKFHRLGSWSKADIYLSQFHRLEVQNKGISMVGWGGIFSLYTHSAALWAFFYRCCQWKWGSFTGLWEEHFRTTHGRMWCGSEVYWDGNRGLPWVLNVSLPSAPTWKKSSLISIKAKTKIIVQRFRAIGPSSAVSAPVQVA